MNDEDAAPEENDHAVKVALYMETLQARMDPDQYGALAQALHEAFHLLAQGREGTISSDDDSSFTPEMNRESATVLTILLTGEMDQRVVEVPGSDGHSGFVLIDPEEADDPAKVQEVRDFIDQWTTERETMDIELDGIARASNPSIDD
ncbi:hypothetical protein GCM10010207_88070 [Streptomyces atratus]|uniref:hypothetical protein n=1 Tax=Streptomyces atratus TaxID=1893 RepID=UPI001670D207|nr:hypothetical protein [Streptomyces atratus]GGT78439.1 hypothetical protein GCM10010207_88070 [Streptomyces atratus]